MSADRRPRRRDRISHEGRQERLIYLVAGGILAAVLVIVAVGVVMTVILPPRAHVLSVGTADFSARDVADRAIYLVSSGNGNAQQNPAEEGMNALIGQEVLFQAGAGMVDPVTDQEVQDEIARQLGLTVIDPETPEDPEAAVTETPTTTETAEVTGTAEATGTAEGTAAATETPAASDPAEGTSTPEATTEPTTEATTESTPEATTESTPEPTPYTQEQYADALAGFLRVAPIGRGDLEDIVRAGLIEDRLQERFRDELPEAGDQLQLWMVSTGDRAAAQRLVDLVRGGASFRGAAAEAGVVTNPDEEVNELGWFAPTSLNERVAPAVQELQAGQVSDPIDDANRVGYEVYFVAERTSDAPYQEEVRDQLARQRFTEWEDEQETALAVERDLSDDEASWIREQVLDFLRDQQAG